MLRQLRVLMVNTGVLPVPPGTAAGAEYHVYHLTNHLAKQGVEVHLVSEVKPNAHFEPNVKLHPFRIKHPPLTRFTGWLLTHTIGGLHAFIKYLEVANKVKPDIIHVHGRLAPRLISMLKGRAPLVYTVHDQSPYTGAYKGPEKLIRTIAYLANEYQTVKKADHIIAVSKQVYKELTEWIGLPQNKVSYIPNGVDTEYYKPAKHKKPYILFVGRLTKRKGVDILVKAYAKIARDYPETKLIIVGDGEEKRNILKLIEKHNIKKQVLLLSNIPASTLRKLYAEASIFVLPSRAEGLPLSLLEAMASQCAIIATRVSGIVDIVNPMENGIIIEPDNVKQLADTLVLLLSDQSFLKKIARKAREKIIKEYSWDIMTKKIIQVYKKVLGYY